jgi:hypothetical protein
VVPLFFPNKFRLTVQSYVSSSDTSSSSSEDDAYELSFTNSLNSASTSLSSDGVFWDWIVAEGSSESITSVPYTSTSIPVNINRKMTSGSAHPHSTRGEAAQPPREKWKEKSRNPPTTSTKRKTLTLEDSHMVVRSGKSIKLLFF